jgi:hypothetical protein
VNNIPDEVFGFLIGAGFDLRNLKNSEMKKLKDKQCDSVIK